VINIIVVESVVELCENGPRRCPHCNGISNLACDKVAVTIDCDHQEVSRLTLSGEHYYVTFALRRRKSVCLSSVCL